MKTLLEIQHAIGQLPPEQVRELVVWLDERVQGLAASDSLFRMYDEEEGACRSRVAEKSG
jgi:hypothetical protein